MFLWWLFVWWLFFVCWLLWFWSWLSSLWLLRFWSWLSGGWLRSGTISVCIFRNNLTHWLYTKIRMRPLLLLPLLLPLLLRSLLFPTLLFPTLWILISFCSSTCHKVSSLIFVYNTCTGKTLSSTRICYQSGSD